MPEWLARGTFVGISQHEESDCAQPRASSPSPRAVSRRRRLDGEGAARDNNVAANGPRTRRAYAMTYLLFFNRRADGGRPVLPLDPACAANAPGSSSVRRRPARGLNRMRSGAQPQSIDVVSRLSVRTTAACRQFPSGEAFPPTTSPEVAFLCSVASSVLRPHPTSHPRTCSACGFCLSRAGPAASHTPWDDVAFSSAE